MSAQPYDHTQIEAAWQKRWEESGVFAAPSHVDSREKAYILDMFPYPSGSGLHVGHLMGYSGSDALARFYRMQGKAVLHPMGWDAFGLPAENYAIKTQVHPAISTAKNVVEYKRQLRSVGLSYDWSKEINSSDPDYYKWTQWLFQLLYSRGLAYRKQGMVNWCSSCQTVLANEQVVGGRCDRCGTEVTQRNLEQWYFRITDYTERLLSDLDTVDWPEKIKAMQRNWIGKSVGAEFSFAVSGRSETITVFTTRPDTLFGATYIVLAPEHPLVEVLVSESQRAAVESYREQASRRTELERSQLTKEKTGVSLGVNAIHPITGATLPIWIADYVLTTYGTGAIMAVPAHDGRDAEFATTFSLPSLEVVSEDGILVNSGSYTGMPAIDAISAIVAEAKGVEKTIYRLRDWLVSRQRFWGSPIPIAYDSAGNEYLIPEDELPVSLPMTVNFAPTGQSPLVQEKEWQQYTNKDTGEVLRRETDTLDTFVCSSWYYLRFPNPSYTAGAFDPEALHDWLPVDTYIGGAEHAVLHLLYARFITKVLFDAGLVPFQEPFTKLHNQGMILGPDHQKMSKSKGNVINPDDVIAELGADTLRTYELFMAPFELEKPWNTKGIVGVRRFLEKIWRLQERVQDGVQTQEEKRIIHLAIKKVTEDIPECRFNTAVAFLMETVNALSSLPQLSRTGYAELLRILSPFAPHITEELWQAQGQADFCSVAPWPEYDPEACKKQMVEYPVQVNGKVRARLSLSVDEDEQSVTSTALAHPDIQKYLQGAVPERIVVIPGRLVSLVVSLPNKP